MQNKLDNFLDSYSRSSDEEELNNFWNENFNSINNCNLTKKPIPTPRAKNDKKGKNIQLLNQKNLIKNFNQIDLTESTFTPKLPIKKILINKTNFTRSGSLDRKLAEVRKLNFSEMKLRLKQQQQQLEESILKKNLKKGSLESNSNFINEPPILPQHKCLVWEAKFYNIATNSINMIISERNSQKELINILNNFESLENEEEFNDFFKFKKIPLFKNFNNIISELKHVEKNNSIDIINNVSEFEKESINDYNERLQEFCDYDLPPDAFNLKHETNNLDCFLNKNIDDVFRHSKFYEGQIEPFEKSGYLLCGKNKTWKQRYFVLKNDRILFYKTQSDVKKNKLKGTIKLSKNLQLIRNENSTSFQIIDKNSKTTYTLTADSVLTTEEWVRVIKNSLNRLNTSQNSNQNNIEIDDWIICRKNGYSKKFKVVLKNKKVYFFKKNSLEETSFFINLNDYNVLESQYTESDDSQSKNEIIFDYSKEYVICLSNKKENCVPIYLVFNNKKSFNDWLYHLSINTIENMSNMTEFEKIIYKLMCLPTKNNLSILDNHPIWEDPILNHSKESISNSLTTLNSNFLKNEASKLFKSIQLFIMVKMNLNSGIEYHVALAQGAFDCCFEYKELQNELFCQLIKQSSTPDLFNKTQIKTNSLDYNFIQSFQLLSLAVTIFEPREKVLWFLKHFLRRISNENTELGKYAIYCQRALDRCLTNGNREYKPSRLEVLAILLRNPYQHSLPFSIPVYFTDDNYIVVGFDGSTTVEEFSKNICSQCDISQASQFTYSLYSDDPINSTKFIFLSKKSKIGDIISKWETTLKNNNSGKFESLRVIKFIFKKRLFFKTKNKLETEKEKSLFIYQIHQNLIDGKIPVQNDLLIYLITLLHLHENNLTSKNVDLIEKSIEKFLPRNLKLDVNDLKNKILKIIEEIGTISKKDSLKIYLNCMKKWPLLGHFLFEASTIDKIKVFLTVDENYFYILDNNFKIVSKYFLNSFLKFGKKENILIIYLLNDNSTRDSIQQESFKSESTFFNNSKLEFKLDNEKANEFVILIADYLNTDDLFSEKILSENNSLLTNESTSSIKNHDFSPLNENSNSSLTNFKNNSNFKFSNRNSSSLKSISSLNSYNSKESNSQIMSEDRDYSEIYSPSYENNGNNCFNKNNFKNPPLLPLHRCYSWERNLYDLATKNFDFFNNKEDELKINTNKLSRNFSFKFEFDNISKNQNFFKLQKRSSIGSLVSGEYFTKLNRTKSNLSNEAFSSLNISQYSLSKGNNVSRCNSYNSNNFTNEDVIEKNILLILNKKLKFKKRIVILKKNIIFYYKNEYDFTKNKLKGKFYLNLQTYIEEEEKCFKLINETESECLTIAAETLEKTKKWADYFKNIIENLNFKNLETITSLIEGWVSIIKSGVCIRNWCKLKEKILFFYKESTDEKAFWFLNLHENKVEESESNDYDFFDWSSNISFESKKEFCISISSKNETETIYLVFDNKKDFDVWYYHLSIASNKTLLGTTFEQNISKLMKIESEDGLIALESSYIWNETAFNSFSETIDNPLTTLKSKTLKDEAKKLFKSIHLFSTVEIKLNAIDYHVALVQSSLELCLDYPELQNEFYCQLYKISSYKNNSNKVLRKDNTPSFININDNDKFVSLQSLQLLAIAVSIFIPKGKVLWFVKHYLRRLTDENTDAGKYAVYCTKALERSMQNGNRNLKPSRMEILSILLRNPNKHSSPHSIPVYFFNNEYLVTGFDGSTTIEEFQSELIKELNLNFVNKNEYSLYCDDPKNESLDYFLEPNCKLGDIISKWETALRKKLGKFENNKIIKLMFRKRMFFKEKKEDEKDNKYLVYKVLNDLKKKCFPINHDLAIQFIALVAQAEQGNIENNDTTIIEKIISDHYPLFLKNKIHQAFLYHDLKLKWQEIKNSTIQDCHRIFLNCAKKWPLFGSNLFLAKSNIPIKVELTLSQYTLPSRTLLWIAVNENHFSILDYFNYQQVFQIKLKNIFKFGCHEKNLIIIYKNDTNEFEIAKNDCEISQVDLTNSIFKKITFLMNKSEIYDVTFLIKDYLLALSTNQ